ncbi:MAG: hypothetical protein E6Q36_08300 [Chryseobacterium sp.]|nr:MAG: hypothetical protein E6Q36_08300 [Chryseobacterium sp.]
MTQEFILQHNTLIAYYMGWEDHSFPGQLQRSGIKQGFRKLSDFTSTDSLRYHEAWDWLIPVIDKIKSDDRYIKFVDYNSSMFTDGDIEIHTNSIERTYQEVVDFIVWELMNNDL